MKRIRISSSIANFSVRLRKRYFDYGDFRWFSKDPTVFFGMYHWLDYLRIILHRGTRVVFWCGSDLLALSSRKAGILKKLRILHYVENDVEWLLLRKHGIKALVQPMFFGKTADFPVSYTQSDTPHVWLCTHPNREIEYGVKRAIRLAESLPEVTFHVYGVSYPVCVGWLKGTPNVRFHPRIPEQQFNEEISHYQAGLRFNSFDGFGEVLAKSVLLGQHPISTIPYDGIDSALSDKELIEKLGNLKNKREPNPSRKYWFDLLSKRIEA